jgi:hypothetical protein
MSTTTPRYSLLPRRLTFARHLVPGLLGAALVGSVFAAAGCGGGGGDDPGPSPSPSAAATTRLKVGLSWATRGRAVNAGSSALSVVFSLSGGDPATGGPVTFPALDRRDAAAGYDETYTSPTEVRTGAYTLTATFYAAKGGTGTVVGRLTRQFTLGADGNGPGISDTLTPDSAVASLTIRDEGYIALGQQRDLAFVAKDGLGNTLDISQGSAVWTLLNSGGAEGVGPAAVGLNAAGQVTAAALGTASLAATVDGKQSAAYTLTVVPAGIAAVLVPAFQSVGVGATQTLGIQVFVPGGTEIPVAASGREFFLAAQPTGAPVGGGADVLTLVNAGGVVTGRAPGFAVVQAAVTGIAGTVKQTVLVGDVISVTSGPYAGLRYVDVTVGNGASPTPNTGLVQVQYTGSLLDGTKFDSSRDRGNPATFSLNRVIAGFSGGIGGGEGIAPMKIGGRRIIVMPPNLGYGDRPQGDLIPANSTLVFDVELLNAN